MSKKRTSTESGKDTGAKDGSDSVFQQDKNSKRTKVATMSDTTLQDLPMELIECILIKVIVMEVMNMKLAKSVWKGKAELVINRLERAYKHWNSILRTTFFRNELHRTLDGIAQETIRLEIIHQSPLGVFSSRIETLKDEVFVLYTVDNKTEAAHIYDRNNLTHLITTILVSTPYPACMKASSMANCVYLLVRQARFRVDVMRISKDEGQKFVAKPFITGLCMTVPRLSVSRDGCLILSHQDTSQTITTITKYCADGRVKATIKLQGDKLTRKVDSVIEKPNGNLVLVYVDAAAQLTEIDNHGIVHRKYQSTQAFYQVSTADAFGRILTASGINHAELLDSEFNVLESVVPEQGTMDVDCVSNVTYNEDRHEIATILRDATTKKAIVTFFRFSS